MLLHRLAVAPDILALHALMSRSCSAAILRQAATPRFVDPAIEPARVRAIYADPDFVSGFCRSGFPRVEMVATLAGEPLYAACGYRVIEPFDGITRAGAGSSAAYGNVPLGRIQAAALANRARERAFALSASASRLRDGACVSRSSIR